MNKTTHKMTHIQKRNWLTIRNMVKKDYWGANVLKARISGEGAGTDYAIKGINIIKFIKKYGEGLMLGPFQK